VWLSSQGKGGIFGDDGKPTAAAAKLLQSGASIMSADLIYQGEFGGIEKSPIVKNPREFAGYTFGYNRTVFANRVHDVLNVLAYVRGHEKTPKQVCLVALDETAAIAAAARFLSASKVDRTALDTHGFRFAKVDDYRSASFLPGGAKYGDLTGLLAASEPNDLWIAGETSETSKAIITSYSAKKDALSLSDKGGSEAAVEWLVK
jgi:hypothetical protein